MLSRSFIQDPPGTQVLTYVMSSFRLTETLPTHAQLIDFFTTILPRHPVDVPLLYHVPRWPGYCPSMAFVHDIVLSITPTPGVYERLNRLSKGRQRAVCFLHRPFRLDRKALPRGSFVLANHKRFDELLTTGYNIALASRLGMDTQRACCIQGYKGDPERRIGIVAPLREEQTLSNLQALITAEIGHSDAHPVGSDLLNTVRAVAIMNAFGPDEVARAVAAAEVAGLIPVGDSSRLLYVTGQPREPGLEAARIINLPVVCVGHRPCEEWGIRFLAGMLQERWTDLAVHIVAEDETPISKSTTQIDVASAVSATISTGL